MKLLFLVVAAPAVVLFGGCAAAPKGSHGAAALPERPREAVQIFDREGKPADWDSMLASVADADVIVIGETHGHPLGLEAAACLWDDVLARRPDAALLMEFFERDQQVALDDYLTGITDDEAFRKAAARTEGNYPAGHARMVEAAKAAGRPVIAANSPRRYVRKAKPDGYSDLAVLREDQQRLFVLPDSMPEGRYREDFYGLMGGADHGPGGEGGAMPPEMIDRMYRSQVMWDATMADSVVRASLRGSDPPVLVVGRFHSDFGGGTIQMIQRARPDLAVRSVSMVAKDSETIEDEDRGRADFVFYIGEGPDEGM